MGSSLQASDCPKLTGSVNTNCITASLLLHLTPASSVYMENLWAWVADHDMDIPAQTQIDIYSGRGEFQQLEYVITSCPPGPGRAPT